MSDQPETEKSQGWDERHPNPSGLPDGDPKKVEQPVAEEHQEVSE